MLRQPDANGSLVAQKRSLPFEEVRTDDFAPGTAGQTGFGYVGKGAAVGLGLSDHKAHFYTTPPMIDTA